jgi:hypothetical protein
MSNRRAQDERIEGTPDGVNAISEIVDVPDAPTIGTATAGIGDALVAFTPATTGGTVSLFTATSSPGSITGTSATSPITVSGLTGGTEYTFTVSGENSTGTSPLSSASNSITVIDLQGDYDALATVTLSASASSISFAGIPSGYKHLQIRYSLTAAAPADTTIRFNGDTSAAYSSHLLRGNGAAAQAYSYTSQTSAYVQFNIGHNTSVAVIDILDYQNTNKNKTIRSLAGWDNNAINGEIDLWSGAWYNTSAVTSLVLTAVTTTFSTNSIFALYGVK